jgi:hypothetical protein
MFIGPHTRLQEFRPDALISTKRRSPSASQERGVP